LEENFKARYASLGDEELLHIAGDRRDLRAEAVSALDVEWARRSLSEKHVRAKKRDEFRQEIQEVRAHRPKRNKSKYFAARCPLPLGSGETSYPSLELHSIRILSCEQGECLTGSLLALSLQAIESNICTVPRVCWCEHRVLTPDRNHHSHSRRQRSWAIFATTLSIPCAC
jgi:hypothetical protein